MRLDVWRYSSVAAGLRNGRVFNPKKALSMVSILSLMGGLLLERLCLMLEASECLRCRS